LLIGGGSGLVPLLSMAAHHAASGARQPMVLVAAARTLAEVALWPELQRWEVLGRGFHARLALSRDTSVPRAQDRLGRLSEADLGAALQQLGNAAAQSTT